MKRILGFALFWVAIGILIGLILSSTFWEVTILVSCLFLGYILFCC